MHPITGIHAADHDHETRDLARRLASRGPAAAARELARFAARARARGASRPLLSILTDGDQPEVARQRALGRIAAELAAAAPCTAPGDAGQPDAA